MCLTDEPNASPRTESDAEKRRTRGKSARPKPPKACRRSQCDLEGKKCLYSWTCGPRSDGTCPYAYFCADWRRSLVPCARCENAQAAFDEEGTPCFLCTSKDRKGARMPVDGYCSEGVLSRYQDASRYLR